MGLLTDIQTIVRNLLPENSKLRISQHRISNDKILDYTLIPFGIGLPYFGPIVDSLGNNLLTIYAPNCVPANGALYLRADYPIASSIFGNIYNLPGDNTITHFRVPNIEPGQSLVQKDNSGNLLNNQEFNELNEKGGAKEKLLDSNQMAPHKHWVIETNVNSGRGLDPAYSDGLEFNTGQTVKEVWTSEELYDEDTFGNKNQIIQQPINLMNPYITCNWIIRIK